MSEVSLLDPTEIIVGLAALCAAPAVLAVSRLIVLGGEALEASREESRQVALRKVEQENREKKELEDLLASFRVRREVIAAGLAESVARQNAASRQEALRSTVEDVFTPPPASPVPSSPSPHATLLQKIASLEERLLCFAPEVYQGKAVQDLLQRVKTADTVQLKGILLNVTALCSNAEKRLVEKKRFCGDLETMREFLLAYPDAAVLAHVEAALSSPEEYLDQAESLRCSFRDMAVARLREEGGKLALSRTDSILASLGYTVLDAQGESSAAPSEHFYATRNRDYRVMLRHGEGYDFSFRLVRVVGSEEEKAHISEYQRQRDKEKITEWCATLAQLKKNLDAEGIPFSLIIQEPSEEDIMVVVDRRLASQKTAADATTALHQQEKKL